MNKTLDAAKAEIATFCGHRLPLSLPRTVKERKKDLLPLHSFLSLLFMSAHYKSARSPRVITVKNDRFELTNPKATSIGNVQLYFVL